MKSAITIAIFAATAAAVNLQDKKDTEIKIDKKLPANLTEKCQTLMDILNETPTLESFNDVFNEVMEKSPIFRKRLYPVLHTNKQYDIFVITNDALRVMVKRFGLNSTADLVTSQHLATTQQILALHIAQQTGPTESDGDFSSQSFQGGKLDVDFAPMTVTGPCNKVNIMNWELQGKAFSEDGEPYQTCTNNRVFIIDAALLPDLYLQDLTGKSFNVPCPLRDAKARPTKTDRPLLGGWARQDVSGDEYAAISGLQFKGDFKVMGAIAQVVSGMNVIAKVQLMGGEEGGKILYVQYWTQPWMNPAIRSMKLISEDDLGDKIKLF